MIIPMANEKSWSIYFAKLKMIIKAMNTAMAPAKGQGMWLWRMWSMVFRIFIDMFPRTRSQTAGSSRRPILWAHRSVEHFARLCIVFSNTYSLSVHSLSKIIPYNIIPTMNITATMPMLVVSFDVFSVGGRIASRHHCLALQRLITLGRQWATAQPIPLFLRVVITAHRLFVFMFHGHNIYYTKILLLFLRFSITVKYCRFSIVWRPPLLIGMIWSTS